MQSRLQARGKWSRPVYRRLSSLRVIRPFIHWNRRVQRGVSRRLDSLRYNARRPALWQLCRFTVFVLLIVCALAPTTRAQDPARDALIEDIEVRGNRRLPKETILYNIQSKPGDVYREATARRDFETLIGLGFFDPLRCKFYMETGPRGGVVIIFEVREYPLIRDLQYRGLKSATESEVLTRFKERRTQVSKEAQLDPAKANAARHVLRELLSEKGHPEARVEIEVEDISATAVALLFIVEEGPRVRVKEILFTGARGQSVGRTF